MQYETDLHSDSYPELESEDEGVVEGKDDNPVVTSFRDWTIAVLQDRHQRGKIDLQPGLQREYVWSSKPELRSRLIESLLLDIPIPPIYFALTFDKRLEVIDGQQRLTTLLNFLNNEFALQKLQRLGSLNGKYFKDLPEEHQDRILDSAQIRSVVIDTGPRPDLRYEIFERLNRGSIPLNEQELRNSIYRGPFNDLLEQLEQDYYWRKVKDTNKPEPRFKEREIILRFFAFANRINHFKGNLKRFLNEYMGTYAPAAPELLEEQAEMFRQTMRNVYAVFGDKSARLYTGNIENQNVVNGRWEQKFSG